MKAVLRSSGGHASLEACAYILKDEHGLVLDGFCVGMRGSSQHIRDWMGFIHGLERAKRLGVTVLDAGCSMELIVKQYNGEWRCKDPRMARLRERAVKSSVGMEVKLKWVPSHDNFEVRSFMEHPLERDRAAIELELNEARKEVERLERELSALPPAGA